MLPSPVTGVYSTQWLCLDTLLQLLEIVLSRNLDKDEDQTQHRLREHCTEEVHIKKNPYREKYPQSDFGQ